MDYEILSGLYGNLAKYILSLQLKYGLERTELPEFFKDHIINILVNAISLHLRTTNF